MYWSPSRYRQIVSQMSKRLVFVFEHYFLSPARWLHHGHAFLAVQRRVQCGQLTRVLQAGSDHDHTHSDESAGTSVVNSIAN